MNWTLKEEVSRRRAARQFSFPEKEIPVITAGEKIKNIKLFCTRKVPKSIFIREKQIIRTV